MRKIALLIIGLFLLSSCETVGEPGTGAIAGGAVGAGLGAIVGSQSGHAGTGTAIGAGAGALTGALVGESMRRQRLRTKREVKEELAREGYGAQPQAVRTQGVQEIHTKYNPRTGQTFPERYKYDPNTGEELKYIQ